MRFDGAQIILGFFGLLFFIGFVGALVAVAIGGKARTEQNGADMTAAVCAFLAGGLLAATFTSAWVNAKTHETRRVLTQRGYVYESTTGGRRSCALVAPRPHAHAVADAGRRHHRLGRGALVRPVTPRRGDGRFPGRADQLDQT